MAFNFNTIKLVTLYGFFDDQQGKNSRHIQIPVDPSVQTELIDMLSQTVQKLGLPTSSNQMEIFDPAQKYGSEERLKLDLTTPYVSDLNLVIALRNLPSNVNALSLVDELEYYYAVFVDAQSRLIYAFRRAAQFKGVIKSKLAMINGGILTLMTSSVFKLDNDFDYIVTSSEIYILRPSGFEFTTNVHGQILQASAANAQSISTSITYLNVATISAYAGKHSKSARLLAAIRGRNDLDKIDRVLLVRACVENGVKIINPEVGQLTPDAGHEYDFLSILDRRAYTATLIVNQPEKYLAASRTQK